MPNNVPSFGYSGQTSRLNFLIQDCLNGMGDFLNPNVGSLNWCESFVFARAFARLYDYMDLVANQLSPASASFDLIRWAYIYNCLNLTTQSAVEEFIGIKQAEFGTPPTLSNMYQLLKELLGSIFIGLSWAPELQSASGDFVGATRDGYQDLVVDGYPYLSPLSATYVYVWQPRDNKDNVLMPNAQFSSTVETYRTILDEWIPSTDEAITMNLVNRGFQDGYGNNYNGLNYNNYLDGYNVVSGTAGSSTLSGTNTAFLLYPNGEIGDFAISTQYGFYPPIQIVDDSGVLQTYFVLSVQSNTQLTLTSPLVNNITNRTYRCLGVPMDTNGVLDGGALISG